MNFLSFNMHLLTLFNMEQDQICFNKKTDSQRRNVVNKKTKLEPLNLFTLDNFTNSTLKVRGLRRQKLTIESNFKFD